jgi:hypothetical protein
LVVLTITIVALASLSGPDAADAVVRVRSGDRVASGFYVQGPDEHRYVVTAADVVDDGTAVLVEPGSEPAEVVGYDARTGVAVLRLAPSEKAVPHVGLADARATVGIEVRALGYGEHDVVSDGPTVTSGSVTQLRKVRGQVRLELSSEVTAGMYGGPTVDEDGKVVGVMLQSGGCAEATDVAAIMSRVQAAGGVPTKSTVDSLLRALQEDVLSKDATGLEVGRLVPKSDRQRLERLLREIRRREADARIAAAKHLSPRAALSVWEARLSPNGLASLRTTPVQQALGQCDDAVSFFSAPTMPRATGAEERDCEAVGLAPLAWDLLAATLRWSGRPRSLATVRVEPSDEHNTLFRAELAAPSLPRPITVWLTRHRGELRVKLFDEQGRVYARSAGDPMAMVGDWEVVHPPAEDGRVAGIERQTTERVHVTVNGNTLRAKVRALHTYRGGPGARFRCNEGDTVEIGESLELEGTTAGATALLPTGSASSIGRDANPCSNWSRDAGAAAVIQLTPAGELLLLRTTPEGKVERSLLRRSR